MCWASCEIDFFKKCAMCTQEDSIVSQFDNGPISYKSADAVWSGPSKEVDICQFRSSKCGPRSGALTLHHSFPLHCNMLQISLSLSSFFLQRMKEIFPSLFLYLVLVLSTDV